MTTPPIIGAALAQWRETRAAYQDYLEAQYAAAVDATNGNLLNARGKAAGIHGHTLFMGTTARAHAYASPELLEWWAVHGRLTFQAFAEQHLEDPDMAPHRWGRLLATSQGVCVHDWDAPCCPACPASWYDSAAVGW
jgi:hypothetical protein